ncbi:glycosyltransferase family 2 protein [Hymenobacter sp. BT664]|uniref:Glycosyltransferase family 2 protein n=1 Tax=Hymenobacter montanus TaxID=2771359 RepID=A0A927BCM4_9BACT|nr:glycosyltransferase family 2 protein [Hymenobacter montanus]MBD2768016.1 glycosyltransferase family 2 protein [Hymenobacter montanus]
MKLKYEEAAAGHGKDQPDDDHSAGLTSTASLSPRPGACADVAIVILNWNGAGFLRRFLPGVLTHADGARVVVADNASTDDSVELLARDFPAVELLLLDRNFGFCEGYNQALAQVDSDFFVLLNSDVEVNLGWLRPLRRLLEVNPLIAAVQPKLLAHADPTYFEYAGAGGGYLDRLAYPFCRGRLFDTLEKDRGQYDDPRPVAWASGACLLVRRSAWQALGGLEPAFFAHMEEIDFCWRLWNAGHEVWYHGGSAVQHVGGGTLPKTNPRKTYLNFRNGLALLYKNAAPGELLPALLQRLLLDGVAGLRFLASGQLANCWAVVRAHFSFYGQLGYWRKRRRLAQPHLRVAERPGVYNGSLVWAYFGRSKRKFSELGLK